MKAIIYKYQLPVQEGGHELTIPQEAVFLHVDNQGGAITLWYQIPLAMLDTSDIRRYEVRWTGRMANSYAVDKYLGTVITGGIVSHIYDITERE